MSTDQNNHANADGLGIPVVHMRVRESFDEVVALNPDLRLEQTADGAIVILTPTGGSSGHRNAKLTYQLESWAQTHGGLVFDSSTLFQLPNGAKRSPDASWIDSQRWLKLAKEDRERYPPLCPDFVIELRSPSDRLEELTAKLREYMACGARSGWLIDPLQKQVFIYRKSQTVEILANIESLAAEDTLPGFVLDLQPIWREV